MTALDAPAPDESTHPYAARRARQLERLDRLEDVGMKLVDQIERVSAGEAQKIDAVLFDKVDIVLAFTRVARAVRQIIVLSQETMGMRAPKGTRGIVQGGAGRNGSGARNPRDSWDYGDTDDYDDDASDEELDRRIAAELDRIHDRMVANGEIDEDDEDEDETFDDDEGLSAEEIAEIEREIFGIRNPSTPPSGCGPPR